MLISFGYFDKGDNKCDHPVLTSFVADFGHSTLPYAEITGNFILSKTDAAQAYYLPSYALWNY
jgi:hypothetical protein